MKDFIEIERESNYKFNNYELNYIENILPNTQEDYITRSEEIAQQIDAIAIKRLNDAAKKVEEYIIKQEDLNKIDENLIKKYEEIRKRDEELNRIPLNIPSIEKLIIEKSV